MRPSDSNPPLIDNWEIQSKWGHWLKIQENDKRDMWIIGEVEVHDSTFVRARKKYKIVGYTRGLISFIYDDGNLHTFTLGNPNNRYATKCGVTTAVLHECLTKKLA